MRYGYFWPYVMSEETEAVRLSGLREVTAGESGEAGVQPQATTGGWASDPASASLCNHSAPRCVLVSPAKLSS